MIRLTILSSAVNYLNHPPLGERTMMCAQPRGRDGGAFVRQVASAVEATCEDGPVGAGHDPDALRVECLRISDRRGWWEHMLVFRNAHEGLPFLLEIFDGLGGCWHCSDHFSLRGRTRWARVVCTHYIIKGPYYKKP